MSDLLKKADTFTSQVLDRFYPPEGEVSGLSFRLRKLKHILFALGELSIWTGINGHGKSLMLNQFILDVISSGESAAIASFEMSAKRTLYRMIRQAIGSDSPAEWLIIQCLEWLGSTVWIYDHTGKANVEHLLKTFHKAASEQGITHFVIDSLMKCGIAEDDYNGQKAFVDRLQNFGQKDGVHVHLVAHARKGQDEHGAPGKMDVKGAGSITDLADNVFSVWRNKGKETKVQELNLRNEPIPDEIRNKPDALLDCLKHRELGGDAEGRYGLYYHRGAMQYTEQPAAVPHCYFEGQQ